MRYGKAREMFARATFDETAARALGASTGSGGGGPAFDDAAARTRARSMGVGVGDGGNPHARVRVKMTKEQIEKAMQVAAATPAAPSAAATSPQHVMSLGVCAAEGGCRSPAGAAYQIHVPTGTTVLVTGYVDGTPPQALASYLDASVTPPAVRTGLVPLDQLEHLATVPLPTVANLLPSLPVSTAPLSASAASGLLLDAGKRVPIRGEGAIKGAMSLPDCEAIPALTDLQRGLINRKRVAGGLVNCDPIPADIYAALTPLQRAYVRAHEYRRVEPPPPPPEIFARGEIDENMFGGDWILEVPWASLDGRLAAMAVAAFIRQTNEELGQGITLNRRREVVTLARRAADAAAPFHAAQASFNLRKFASDIEASTPYRKVLHRVPTVAPSTGATPEAAPLSAQAFQKVLKRVPISAPGPIPNASQLFTTIQQALAEGRDYFAIGRLAAQFNGQRIAELSSAGILQQIDAARSRGPLRVPVWVGWTAVHGDMPGVASSAPPRPLAIAGFIELTDPLFSGSARIAAELALARAQVDDPFVGGAGGWLFGLGLEGLSEPIVIFHPQRPQLSPQPGGPLPVATAKPSTGLLLNPNVPAAKTPAPAPEGRPIGQILTQKTYVPPAQSPFTKPTPPPAAQAQSPAAVPAAAQTQSQASVPAAAASAVSARVEHHLETQKAARRVPIRTSRTPQLTDEQVRTFWNSVDLGKVNSRAVIYARPDVFSPVRGVARPTDWYYTTDLQIPLPPPGSIPGTVPLPLSLSAEGGWIYIITSRGMHGYIQVGGPFGVTVTQGVLTPSSGPPTDFEKSNANIGCAIMPDLCEPVDPRMKSEMRSRAVPILGAGTGLLLNPNVPAAKPIAQRPIGQVLPQKTYVPSTRSQEMTRYHEAQTAPQTVPAAAQTAPPAAQTAPPGGAFATKMPGFVNVPSKVQVFSPVAHPIGSFGGAAMPQYVSPPPVPPLGIGVNAQIRSAAVLYPPNTLVPGVSQGEVRRGSFVLPPGMQVRIIAGPYTVPNDPNDPLVSVHAYALIPALHPGMQVYLVRTTTDLEGYVTASALDAIGVAATGLLLNPNIPAAKAKAPAPAPATRPIGQVLTQKPHVPPAQSPFTKPTPPAPPTPVVRAPSPPAVQAQEVQKVLGMPQKVLRKVPIPPKAPARLQLTRRQIDAYISNVEVGKAGAWAGTSLQVRDRPDENSRAWDIVFPNEYFTALSSERYDKWGAGWTLVLTGRGGYGWIKTSNPDGFSWAEVHPVGTPPGGSQGGSQTFIDLVTGACFHMPDLCEPRMQSEEQ